MALELRQEQKQLLTQAQLQSLDILMLTNQELDGFLTEEYLENPLLECSVDKQADMIRSLEEVYEQGKTFQEHYLTGGKTGSDIMEIIDGVGKTHAKKENMIYDHIFSQLDTSRFTKAEQHALFQLTYLLDEKGFFPYSPEEAAAILRLSKPTVSRLLKILRSLEPPGIFARDVPACLIAQLQHQGIEDPVLYEMINTCMDDVLSGRYARVTRKLGITTANVREYIRLIGTLNPRPLMSIVNEDETQYIVPDIITSYENGHWQITLNDRWMGEYRLDDYYLRMMREAKDPVLKSYFKEKLQRAHFLLDAVERRRETIIRITEAILHMQKDFFLHDEKLKPMTLADVAEIINMHPSTVSRAIRGKYLQYTRCISMKQLFRAKLGSADTSMDAVREKLLQIIEKEDRNRPLSDSKISEMLTAEGLPVSRRTVTKYRLQLGIPDSRQRS